MASAVVAAIVSGAVSLAVPWAQWGVDRRRLRVEHQREAIAKWRAGLHAWEAENGGGVAVRPASFIKEAWYFSLRPHLTDEERKEFEKSNDGDISPLTGRSADASVIVTVGGQSSWNHFTRKMVEAIDRIEREWKLP